MSVSSVLNPYTKFYALDGITPLSGGSVQFYQNRTTTPLSIFADNMLTVPQDNPYELDAGGAIAGDVYFAGLATLVVYDSIGAEINSFDDVACFSQSAPWDEWSPFITYEEGGTNIVEGSDGTYYISIQPNNINHDPVSSPLWWEPVIDYILKSQTVVPPGEVAVGDATTGLTGVPFKELAGITRIPRTSDTILAADNNGDWIDVTSGTFTQTFDPAADLGTKWFCYYSNNGTGDVTIPSSDGVTNWIMYPGEMRLFQCDGTDIRSIVITPFYKSFTSSGSFVKPPGYKQFSGRLWGAGGGGNNTGTATGGGGGACVPFTILAALLAATTTYTQAAGGAPNSAGGNSTFGSHVTAYGGGPGANGSPGSGGGIFSAGSSATSPGQPARNIGTSEANEGFGGGAGGSSGVAGGASPYGGAGGGYNNSAGGNSVYGGAGGGQTGGNSAFGGDGGSTGQNGQQPGGGGGPGATTGGAGQLDIWGEV